ncbi:MAG TPA: NlpC/P60 family protein [Actinomycetota bacterium]|nr:NlpC/P60 family protein [Actinomycetota bacterium]
MVLLAAHTNPVRPAVAPRLVTTVSPAQHAVATALSELGKPYRWGGLGPSSFDCSGLVKFSWASAGVAMPHSAALQYAGFPKVPRGQLAPGDLVFFGSPITHVGLYLGNGVMVQAPGTGRRIDLSTINLPGYAGAVRPSPARSMPSRPS